MSVAPRRSRWLFFAFFAALGGLCAWYGWSQANAYWALSTRGIRAEAVIVRYEEVRGRRSTSWYPVFKFATRDGRSVEATSGVSADRGSQPRGRPVLVVYEPDHPSNVRLASALEGGPGITPWVLGVMAFLMFALASVFLMPERPRKIH